MLFSARVLVEQDVGTSELVRVQTTQTPTRQASTDLVVLNFRRNAGLRISHTYTQCHLHGYTQRQLFYGPALSQLPNACAVSPRSATHLPQPPVLTPRSQSCHGRHRRACGRPRTLFHHLRMAKFSWKGGRIANYHRTPLHPSHVNHHTTYSSPTSPTKNNS